MNYVVQTIQLIEPRFIKSFELGKLKNEYTEHVFTSCCVENKPRKDGWPTPIHDQIVKTKMVRNKEESRSEIDIKPVTKNENKLDYGKEFEQQKGRLADLKGNKKYAQSELGSQIMGGLEGELKWNGRKRKNAFDDVDSDSSLREFDEPKEQKVNAQKPPEKAKV